MDRLNKIHIRRKNKSISNGVVPRFMRQGTKESQITDNMRSSVDINVSTCDSKQGFSKKNSLRPHNQIVQESKMVAVEETDSQSRDVTPVTRNSPVNFVTKKHAERFDSVEGTAKSPPSGSERGALLRLHTVQ